MRLLQMLGRIAGLALVLAAAVYGGRRWQARIDVRVADSVTARAKALEDSVTRWSRDSIASLTERRRAETVARGLAQEENARLRRVAAGHATADRQQDSTLAAATSDAERVPILTGQRDDARAAYANTAKADTANMKVIASLRVDSARADSVLRKTKEGHALALGALRSELSGTAVKLEAPKLDKKFLGFLPPLECVAGYGVNVEPQSPVQVAHGAQLTCGFKVLALRL